MNPPQRLLQKILLVQTRSPVLTLCVALGLAVLSVLYTAGNLDFQTGQMDLISPKNRLVRLSKQIESFDDLDSFVVAIENRNNARSLEFLHALVPLLEADKENYRQVFYRLDPEVFKPWSLLYLDRKDLLDLQDALKEHLEFIRNLSQSPLLNVFFKEINREMTSAMVGELFTGFLDPETADNGREPLDLRFLIRVLEEMQHRLDGGASFVSPWESFFTEKSWKTGPEEGYFWTDNKGYLLLFVTPRKIGGSFANALDSLTALRRTIAHVRIDFPDLRVGVTGQEALNEDEMNVALHDMGLATLISLLSLAALLAVFWRGFRRPLLEMIELLTALSWTFGLTTLFIGHLNILSVTFAPLLLGLGIDYGIHWFARYQEEEKMKTASKIEGIEATMMKLGPGILLAGVTAALSFFPLVLTGFKGLVELGIITSIGMVMTTVTTLCLLPALTLLFDKPVVGGLHSPRIKPLLRFTNRRAAAVLLPAALGLAISLGAAGGVAFDLNMLHLQSRTAESVTWEKKLLKDSQRSSMYGAILANSLNEVREKTVALEALSTVSKVQSIRTIFPDEQEEKTRLLKGMKPLIAGVGTFSGSNGHVNLAKLDDTLGRIRFKMLDSSRSDWGSGMPIEAQMIRVRELIDRLRQRFDSLDQAKLDSMLQGFEKALMQDMKDKFETLRANVNTRPMQVDDLPRDLVQRYVGPGGQYLIRVFPSQDIWEPAFLGRFVHDLRSVDPDAIGDPVTLYTFTRAFRNASIRAALYAVGFISLLLLFTFRRPLHTLLVMTPLLMGTGWTIGLMRLFGVDFNLANSIFLPLIVGAGVEYGIIILQRWQQQGGDKGEVVLPFSTAKGVILAGLTTTVGFGSLTISDHQGIYSLGLLAMVGSLSILAAAILFLPALLQFVRRPIKHR
jgi:hopanoid biosynthesis associated RND transporter like protein HpnN